LRNHFAPVRLDGKPVALFADAWVRFLKESIDRRTLEELVTLKGGHFEDD
jgi:hypothetical protein